MRWVPTREFPKPQDKVWQPRCCFVSTDCPSLTWCVLVNLILIREKNIVMIFTAWFPNSLICAIFLVFNPIIQNENIILHHYVSVIIFVFAYLLLNCVKNAIIV